jgi:hypothetical protein
MKSELLEISRATFVNFSGFFGGRMEPTVFYSSEAPSIMVTIRSGGSHCFVQSFIPSLPDLYRSGEIIWVSKFVWLVVLNESSESFTELSLALTVNYTLFSVHWIICSGLNRTEPIDQLHVQFCLSVMHRLSIEFMDWSESSSGDRMECSRRVLRRKEIKERWHRFIHTSIPAVVNHHVTPPAVLPAGWQSTIPRFLGWVKYCVTLMFLGYCLWVEAPRAVHDCISKRPISSQNTFESLILILSLWSIRWNGIGSRSVEPLARYEHWGKAPELSLEKVNISDEKSQTFVHERSSPSAAGNLCL